MDPKVFGKKMAKQIKSAFSCDTHLHQKLLIHFGDMRNEKWTRMKKKIFTKAQSLN